MAGRSSWTRLNVWTNSIAAAAARADRDGLAGAAGCPAARRQACQHSSTSVGRSRLPPARRLYCMASVSRAGAAAWRSRTAWK